MRVSDGEVLMTMGPRVNLQQNVLINAANFVAMVWAKAYMNKHSFEEPEWKIAMVLLHPDNEETTRIETERELGQYFNNTCFSNTRFSLDGHMLHIFIAF